MKLKQKQTDPQRITVIDIQLTKALVVALSCVLLGVMLFAYLTLAGERAAASEIATSGEASLAASSSQRWFYVTKQKFDGSEALTACAPGYHMASVWEMPDPSRLTYNTALGHTRIDSGQGPPSQVSGWVGTGYFANSEGEAGEANCDVWSGEEQDIYGSAAVLESKWEGDFEDIGAWSARRPLCSLERRVWCIGD